MALNSSCEMSDTTDVVRGFTASIDNLQNLKGSDSNIARQRCLEDIQALFSKYKQIFISNANLDSLLENLAEVLFECLTDKTEKCRELSAKILCILLDSISDIQFSLCYISTTLVQLLGKSDNRERSEEVRLLEVDILYKVIEKFDGNLLKYINDISDILCMCITDEYPAVKRRSCECTSLLAVKHQSSFHMISSSVLKPLCHTISHQHLRTRAICVKTIGQVICEGNRGDDFKDVGTYVVQRLFDHSPIVRKAATEVIGQLLVSFGDRYSFFHLLIPLILSTLYDEVLEIKQLGLDLWNKAGEKYLMENEKDYKDLMDFPRPDPENYPNADKRPSLGCRILVQRHLHSILPPLTRELKDWVPETRLKSAYVLHSLILHAENKATIELNSIIDGVVTAATDTEKKVSDTAMECAEILGFFLDPNLLCDSVLVLVHKSPSSVHLSILAAVLRGNRKTLPTGCFQAICKLLSEASICRVKQAEEQANLLLCIESTLQSHDKIDQVSSYQLFSILCTVSGLTMNTAVEDKARSLFEFLANKCSCSLQSLFKMHALTLLNSLLSNNELWTPHNAEMPIFYFIVQSDYANEDILMTAIPVMTNNLNTKKDVKLRSKIFTLAIQVFKKLPPVQDNELAEKVLSLLQKGIFPNLTWAPGRAASSLRTIAVASLYEIISKNCINEFVMKSISNDLLPILAALADDHEMTNRLLACKILESLLPKLYGHVPDYKIHSLCHDFLPCMDDGSDDVRILATRVMKAYVIAFPKDYCWSAYRTYLQDLYQNMLIHIDDKNEKIKENVFNLLKDTAFAEPQLLLDEIEKKRYMIDSSDYCENLLEHVKKLDI